MLQMTSVPKRGKMLYHLSKFKYSMESLPLKTKNDENTGSHIKLEIRSTPEDIPDGTDDEQPELEIISVHDVDSPNFNLHDFHHRQTICKEHGLSTQKLN